MSVEAKLGRQAIGAAGELFLQYQLIKRGIDSARLTTDSGIDLVMYVPGSREAHTIQVKATNTNYPNGPGTSPQLWWIFPRTCKAQWLAVVDLTRDRAWLLPIEDALREARGNDSKGNTNLQWYIGEKRSCPESGVNREHGRRFRFTTCKSAKKEITPVPVRVSATDRIRTKIDALFAEDRELPEILEEVARLGAQLLMQAALEAEVTEFLGRERYQRTAACLDANDGSRNGYRPVTVKTTTGPVTLERPKLRGTTVAFASRLFGKHVTKTNALETLVIAAFVRGLSVRDVQATLAETLGDQAAISKSTVSEVCKAIRAEYQAWARRRLDEIMLDYLFLDASFFRMHPGSPAEPVLAAWGITTEGKPVFVGLSPGTGESTDAWADFLTDLGERGLGCPLLVVSDGAKGLIAAIEQIYPKALRQRCLIHRLRNVLAKIPTGMQAEVRDGYWAIFDTTDLNIEPGPQLVEIVDKRIEAFAAKYSDLYPAAMRILLTDKAGLTAYLRFPVEHHGRVRHSNFIERSFGETKRRTKVIGRFPGETSAISLVWAVLDRASAGWRGLTMTPVGTRLLQDLRRSLLDPPRELRPPPSTTSGDTDQADPISAIA